MDTSEIYIKMCDCDEIQGYALTVLADKEMPHKSVRVCNICRTEWGNCTKTHSLDSLIWLPRQDQLQEMMTKYDLSN